MSPPLAGRSVFDPDYVDQMSPRAAARGALRGLLDASPIGAADLLHQTLAGQSRLTMPGIVAGLLGVPQTPPPGEALAGLLGIDGSGDAYETGRAATNAATTGLLALLARSAPRPTIPASAQSQAGAIFPEGKRKLIEALENRGTENRFDLGSLEPRAFGATQRRRQRLGMSPVRDNVVVVDDRDVQHMLKRIDSDGLSSAEVARLAEEVLSPGAVARMGDHGLVNLWGPRRIEFVPGQQFQPLGILRDPISADQPHLYGVVPKGWSGRK